MSSITETKEPTTFQTYKLIPGTPWFMMYGGSSEDGRGSGQYLGRTFYPSHALTFYRKHIKGNPYSVGHIMAIFDDRTEHVDEEWLKRETKRQDKLVNKINSIRAVKGLPPADKPEGYGTFA